MLSEEEKKTIEILKKDNEYFEKHNIKTNASILLNLIEKQQAEIEKKDKIIDEMADALVEAEEYNPKNIPALSELEKTENIENIGYKEVIEYFTNKVEEDK